MEAFVAAHLQFDNSKTTRGAPYIRSHEWKWNQISWVLSTYNVILLKNFWHLYAISRQIFAFWRILAKINFSEFWKKRWRHYPSCKILRGIVWKRSRDPKISRLKVIFLPFLSRDLIRSRDIPFKFAYACHTSIWHLILLRNVKIHREM